MNRIAFVFQDTRLLKASILENMRAARPDATREQVLNALHNAQCDDIIEKFPKGIDTILGTKGIYLSGGESSVLRWRGLFSKTRLSFYWMRLLPLQIRKMNIKSNGLLNI